MRMAVSLRSMFVSLLTMLVRQRRVMFRLVMLVALVMRGGLVMVVGSGVVMRGGRMMVLAGRMLVRHIPFPPKAPAQFGSISGYMAV